MANFNFNKAILGGKLTADPELKTTPNGTSVTQFSVAINRKSKDGEQQADFINCVAWKNTAEFITKYFRKGSSISITGRIQTRSWKDQNGNTRYATEVVVEEAGFVDSKNESQPAAQQNAQPSYVPEAYTAPKFEEMSDDEELPF